MVALVATGQTGTQTVDGAPGWDTILIYEYGVNHFFEVYARKADGTETLFSPDYSSAIGHACHIFHFTAGTWDDTGDLSESVAFATFEDSGDPDPPELITPWGPVEAYWIAGGATRTGSTPTVTSYPDNYTDGAFDVIDYFSWDALLLTSMREYESASDDPTLIDWNLGAVVTAFTVAVAPPGANRPASGLFFGAGF
jgi:hypothetical protein